MLKTKFRKTTFGRRTLAYNAPRLWNALPLHIRTEGNLETFKKSVKTLLLRVKHPKTAPWGLQILALYVYSTLGQVSLSA